MTRRAGLSQAAVVEMGATLADERGLDALALAPLADRLGVRIPSLYNHVAGLPALKRELALLGARELAARLGRAAIGRAGDDAVVALAQSYRAFATERPGLYAACLQAPDPADTDLTSASNEVVAIVAAALGGYGLRDDDAIHAIRGLRSLLHGFVALELVGGFGLPLDREESFRRLVATFIAGIHRSETGQTG